MNLRDHVINRDFKHNYRLPTRGFWTIRWISDTINISVLQFEL